MHISEKDFEDWVCDNIQDVVRHDNVHLIGRQHVLPNGKIPDVLAAHDEDGVVVVTVIELKATDARTSALVQLLGYMGAVRDILDSAPDQLGDNWAYDDYRVEGIIAAPGWEDDLQLCIRGTPSVRFAFLYVSKHAALLPDSPHLSPAEVNGCDLTSTMRVYADLRRETAEQPQQDEVHTDA